MEAEPEQIAEASLAGRLSARAADGWRVAALAVHPLDTTDGRPDFLVVFERG